MVYGYVRVSTTTQTVDNQKFEISQYCSNHSIHGSIRFVEEIKSGKISYKDRVLGKILRKMKPNDVLICAELSRLGRSMLDVMEILNNILKKKIKLISIKENMIFDETISSKVISFAFSLAAEIERNLISQRTKEALELRKAQGIKLGRPIGSPNKHYMLDRYENTITKMLALKCSYYSIAKKCKCNQNTLKNYIVRKHLI